MPDTQNPQATPPPEAKDFPYLTALATLAALFLFVGLVLVMYQYPNTLGGPKAGPAADPAEKLDAVRARNQAVLDGTDPTAKMNMDRATAEVLARTAKSKGAKDKFGRLPFPVPPPAAAPEKKPEKKP